jgi:GNAT superfamily N-acetyltransferase
MADIHVLESDGRVVGCAAHVPVSVWVDGHRLRLAIGCDLIVIPEYRGQGGSRRLVEAFFASEHGFDVNLGVVNESSSHVLGRHAGNVSIGRAPVWVRFRTRGASRTAPLRAALTLAERLYGAVASWPQPSIAVEDLPLLGPEVDELARESASFAPCIRVRDAAYLRWHWLEQPGASLRVRAVREAEGGLRGVAVVGARDGPDRRVGMVVDLLARDQATTRALLVDAWKLLAAEGCPRVTCVYLDPRPWARRALLRAGFRRSSAPGPWLAGGAHSSRARGKVEQLDRWYLTYGDTDI